MNLAPIVLFVYNRPWHTAQTLYALAENELAKDSVLFIYADGAKESESESGLIKIAETRAVLNVQQWFKEVHIIESKKNRGLAKSVIEGVTEIVNKYDKVIVLEDDLITSKGFLNYMNNGLNKFADNRRVMQISGYCFPVESIIKRNSSFFIPLCTSWGWATWKRSWAKFDEHATGYELLKSDKVLAKKFNLDDSYFYSKMLISQMESNTIDSWAIRWWWSFFKENGIALFPDNSLVKNIGFGMESTHTKEKNPFPTKEFDPMYSINRFPINITISEEYFEHLKLYFRNASIKNKDLKIGNPFSFFLRKITDILKGSFLIFW